MLPFEDRYTRQRQLAEVGLRGQERIAAHRAAIPDDSGARVAALYLTRAGVASVSAHGAVRVDDFALHARDAFEFELARDYGLGCLTALQELKRALGMLEVNGVTQSAETDVRKQ